jgi:phosphatidylethanolamine/phosphatidyl-N-methylethanolamine N-methyltransferase
MYAMVSAAQESLIYHRLSGIYDGLFAPFFGGHSKRAIKSLNIPSGARVLEVGVGTGATLDAYPLHAQLTGIDLSDEMLRLARQKVERAGWSHVELQQMDALDLQFADDTFDYVLGFHIVTVVPDHSRLMQEMARVCKPGGKVVVVNFFRSEKPAVAGILDAVNPITLRLGWHTKLSLQDLVDGAPLQVVDRHKVSPRSLFTVVVAEKLQAASQK